MREIKFRGVSKRTGKMVYGYFLRCRFGHGEGFAIKDTVNHVNDGYIDLIPEEIIQGTESQFTGLKDKNGAEIYEGDILQYYDGETWKAVFELSQVGQDWMSWPEDYEVIGNIYENPDLIN